MRKVIASIFALCSTVMACTTSGSDKLFEPHIEISTKSIDFDAEGGVKEIQIISNFDYVILPNANWLTAEKGENFMVKVKAESSNATESRSAKIYITSNHYGITETIIVSQGAYVPTFDTSGWAEMPVKVEDSNLEYCHHDKLPSNNKLRNYSFCFDKSKHCALWVAYPLHECYTEGRGKRTDAWSYDPCCVEDVYEPNLRNAYYPQGGSSFSHSRGHQLPSADRLASNEDNATTFYYTNMTPQLQSLNGGTWASLEGNITNKWICSDTLYVVTGAHFEAGVNYDYAWDNKGSGKACAVPTHYYKVVLRTKKGNSGKWVGNCSASELQCVGFWFEHKDNASRQTMTVAEIEKKTGHTFFPNVKNAPKSTYTPSDWQ